MQSFNSFLKNLLGPSSSERGDQDYDPSEEDGQHRERRRHDASTQRSSRLFSDDPDPGRTTGPTADSDTPSASVDIDDLIEEFDGPGSDRSQSETNHFSWEDDAPSRKSAATADTRPPCWRQATVGSLVGRASAAAQSYFSLNNLVSTSQSYNTAKDNDETISFYSALHDGFSLDEYEWRDKFGHDFFNNSRAQSAANRNGDRDQFLQANDFEILWSDLTFVIERPIANISGAWTDLKRNLFTSLPTTAAKLTNGGRHERSDVDIRAQHRNPKSEETCAELENLCEYEPQRGDTKVTILQHLNGSFRSGQLTAVMGPSGAGKTSLLNILSLRREEGFTGHLCVESEDKNDQHKIRISAIPQHDHLPEYLTVRENLMFASRLKNSRANHEKNVCRVSQLLGLDDCLDTKTKKISGGQQKRVSIAQELLSRPDILILDEPTSGLDSSTCLKTLSVLKDLVRASARKLIDPIAIVLTIHQPPQEAFSLFDKVYVMANGGVAIYDGPPGKCADFVHKHTGVSMQSTDYNPASFMIDIASGEYGQEPIRQLERRVRSDFEKNRCQSVAHSRALDRRPSKTDLVADAKNGCSPSPATRNQKPIHLDQRLVKGFDMNSGEFIYKTRVLTERFWLSMMRDPRNTVSRISFHLLLPFGLAYLMGTEPGGSNACPKYREDYSLLGLMKSNDYISPEMQNDFMLALENLGVMFITIYSCISANIAAVTLMFTIDMNSSLKEYYNGWYSMNSYLFARILSNIPLDLLLPTTTIALMFVTTGQNTGNGDMPYLYRIVISALGVVLGSCIGELMGMIFGAIYMGHVTTALFASQGATLPFVLLSGFVARTKNMSKFVRWLSLTSLYKHCLEVSFIARYGWNVCDCEPSEIKGREPRITGVPDRLMKFVEYWQSSQQQAGAEQAATNETNNKDLFRVMAKQISLYNTYGIEVQSCKQVVPYELYDFGLTESDLPYSFAALVLLMLSMLILLILVVKFVVTYRISL